MPPIIIYHCIKKKKCISLPTVFYSTFFCFNYEVVIVKILLNHHHLGWKFHRTQLLS